jgi:hypothetical protein
MRDRTGKSARLTGVVFDRDAVNVVPEASAPAEKVEAATEEAPAKEKAAEENKSAGKSAEKEEKPQDKK